MNKTLLFVHIPKTAGSTLHNILNNQYQNVFSINGLNPKESIDYFKNLKAIEIKKIDVVKGHLALQLYDFLMDPVLLTFLRDPVDRIISSYYYIKRAYWNRNHSRVKKLGGLHEFVEFAIENGLDNMQTRHLSNSIKSQPDKNSVKMINEGYPLLKIAKENLDKFDFIFYQTQFDEALVILKKSLKWQKQPFYNVINQTNSRPKKSTIPSKTVKMIEEMEKFDIELFDYAKMRNKELIETHPYKYDLEVFKTQNLLFQKLNNSLPIRIIKKLLPKNKLYNRA